MNRIKVKIMLILILISVALSVNTPKVYALGWIGPGETQGTKPVTPVQEHYPTPDPTPDTSTTTTTTTDTTEPSEPKVIRHEDVTITEYRYRYINGYVREDLGNQVAEGTDDALHSVDMIGVADVQVTAKSGSKTYTALTNSEGFFSFNDMEAGSYDLEFRYGDINVLQSEQFNVSVNSSRYANVLKYNGHDYKVVGMPSATTSGDEGSYEGYEESTGTPGYINITKEEVIMGERGVTQLYLVIDSSYSAHNTMVTMDNGSKKTRLQVELEAAKQLISDILATGNNIYIGIVSYSGDTHITSGLSKDEAFLNKVLDRIQELPYVPGTDIIKALTTANNLFYNKDPETSNRAIVLISDGVPTISGNTVLYWDDTDAEMNHKLYDIIGPDTTKCVEDLIADKINMMALIIKSDDKDETDYVNKVFKISMENNKPKTSINGLNFITAADGTELADAIKQDIKEWIIETKETIEKIDEVDGYKKQWSGEWSDNDFEISGKENKERRELVDSYFSKVVHYNHSTDENDVAGKSILFKEIDKPNDINKMKELSKYTYMTANSGPYTIEDLFETYTIEHNDVDNMGVAYTWKETHVCVPTGYENQDMTLGRRASISFTTQITLTDFRFVLSTGQVLDSKNAKLGSKSLMLEYVDPEIAHGATVELEYTISVKNNSSLQCNHLELITYLPQNLVFSNERTLLSNSQVTNKDMGWQGVSLKSEFDKGYIDKTTLDKYNGREGIKLIKDNGNKGKDGFCIPKGGTFITKVMVSKVIDADLIAIDEAAVELLGYQCTNNRIATFDVVEGAKKLVKREFPGNIDEPDYTTCTNPITIIPPTGKTGYDSKRIIFLAVSSISLGILVVSIKNIINRKNNRH